MTREDRARWDAKHAAAIEAGAGPAGEASARFLDAVDAHLPRSGRALDVACGRGGATVRLARRGLRVTALDVSLVALAETRRRADEAGVARRVRTLAADLDAGLPPRLGKFDLVLVTHFHAPALWPALRAALAPGGVLAMETLTTRNLDLGLPSPGARYLVEPGRILGAAEGLDVLLHAEEVSDGSHRARLVARRPAGPAVP